MLVETAPMPTNVRNLTETIIPCLSSPSARPVPIPITIVVIVILGVSTAGLRGDLARDSM